MMDRLFHVIAILLSALILAGCSNRPKGVMSNGKTADLLTDIFIAQSYLDSESNGYTPDSVRDGIILGVLEQHGVSEAEFDSTLAWYGRNMDLYKELFENVDKKLVQRQHKIPGMEDMTDALQNDFWPYSRHTMITENSVTDDLGFSLPAALEKGDKIDWTFRVNKTTDAKVFIGVDYEDGSSSFVTKTIYGDRKVAVSLQTDTARKARRVYGNYHLSSKGLMPVFIDSIVLRSAPFDSVVYFRVHSQKNYYGPKRKIVKTEAQKDTTDTVGRTVLDGVSKISPAPKKPLSAGKKLVPVRDVEMEGPATKARIRRAADGSQGLINNKR